jgi:hypothetical protein
MFNIYKEEKTTIKPTRLAVIPILPSALEVGEYMNLYRNMSPGLMALHGMGTLVTVVYSDKIMWYTTDQDALDHFRNDYSENVAVANLIHFQQELKKLEIKKQKSVSQKTAVVPLKQRPLQGLLDQIRDKEVGPYRHLRNEIAKKRKGNNNEDQQK